MSLKKVSLEDISKELGVSKSLVSFVMNGKAKEMRVSDSMIEKVLLKAKEMNYKANPMARALRTGKSHTIGLIVADISNSFYSKIAKSIENEASKKGYHVIFGSSDESDKKSGELIDLFYNKRIDGLIISPTNGDKENLIKLRESGFPVVLIDRYFKDVESNMVIANNLKGTYDIVNKLIKNGNKKIGYVTHSTESTVVEFGYKGYVKAMEEFGIALNNNIIKEVSHANNEKETRIVVTKMIEIDKVDAIFFFNNNLAIEGGKVVRNFNKNNTKNIEIGCFDSSRYLELLDVPFVSAVQKVEELGKISMKLLLLQMKSKSQLNAKEILNAELIDRLN